MSGHHGEARAVTAAGGVVALLAVLSPWASLAYWVGAGLTLGAAAVLVGTVLVELAAEVRHAVWLARHSARGAVPDWRARETVPGAEATTGSAEWPSNEINRGPAGDGPGNPARGWPS